MDFLFLFLIQFIESIVEDVIKVLRFCHAGDGYCAEDGLKEARLEKAVFVAGFLVCQPVVRRVKTRKSSEYERNM